MAFQWNVVASHVDGNADSGVAWVRANRFCLVGFDVGFLPFDTSFAYWSLGGVGY